MEIYERYRKTDGNFVRLAKKAANLVHLLLYFFLFLMPISGFLYSVLAGRDVSFFGIFTIKSFLTDIAASKIFWRVHQTSAYCLVALLVMHIFAAAYHHFVLKDKALISMLKGGER